jgi:peptidoglycan hydrolase-like amidase
MNGSDWTDQGKIFWVPEKNANVSEDETACKISLGPEIAVGLWEASTSDAKENAFKIKANREYLLKDSDGKTLGTIPGGTTTKIKYAGDKKLKIYNSIKEITVKKEVSFVTSDGQNELMIFDTSRPNSSYDRYRGKIKIRYSDTSKSVWIINTLPMEHYVWGMGETTGTGDIEHTKVMTTIFRTYGYWYLEYATKYLPYGFKIKSNSGSQIYWGYDWETKYPNIKKAAAGTEGRVATYKDEDEIALTPYSSWSDGKTRSFKERWGSSDYPWCKSVKDPYGKHPSLSTKKLEAAGNHMVGLVGNGSVKLASKYDWSYSKILQYYYTGIDLTEKY